MTESASGVKERETIDTNKIYATHTKIKEIVEAYSLINLEVSRTTQEIKENWVGEGRNEFETQYNLLIRKIDDFGDTLKELYDALVSAEADYEALDAKTCQQLEMATNS